MDVQNRRLITKVKFKDWMTSGLFWFVVCLIIVTIFLFTQFKSPELEWNRSGESICTELLSNWEETRNKYKLYAPTIDNYIDTDAVYNNIDSHICVDTCSTDCKADESNKCNDPLITNNPIEECINRSNHEGNINQKCLYIPPYPKNCIDMIDEYEGTNSNRDIVWRDGSYNQRTCINEVPCKGRQITNNGKDLCEYGCERVNYQTKSPHGSGNTYEEIVDKCTSIITEDYTCNNLYEDICKSHMDIYDPIEPIKILHTSRSGNNTIKILIAHDSPSATRNDLDINQKITLINNDSSERDVVIKSIVKSTGNCSTNKDFINENMTLDSTDLSDIFLKFRTDCCLAAGNVQCDLLLKNSQRKYDCTKTEEGQPAACKARRWASGLGMTPTPPPCIDHDDENACTQTENTWDAHSSTCTSGADGSIITGVDGDGCLLTDCTWVNGRCVEKAVYNELPIPQPEHCKIKGNPPMCMETHEELQIKMHAVHDRCSPTSSPSSQACLEPPSDGGCPQNEGCEYIEGGDSGGSRAEWSEPTYCAAFGGKPWNGSWMQGGEFIAALNEGDKDGYVFKHGDQGTGYYLEEDVSSNMRSSLRSEDREIYEIDHIAASGECETANMGKSVMNDIRCLNCCCETEKQLIIITVDNPENIETWEEIRRKRQCALIQSTTFPCRSTCMELENGECSIGCISNKGFIEENKPLVWVMVGIFLCTPLVFTFTSTTVYSWMFRLFGLLYVIVYNYSFLFTNTSECTSITGRPTDTSACNGKDLLQCNGPLDSPPGNCKYNRTGTHDEYEQTAHISVNIASFIILVLLILFRKRENENTNSVRNFGKFCSGWLILSIVPMIIILFISWVQKRKERRPSEPRAALH